MSKLERLLVDYREGLRVLKGLPEKSPARKKLGDELSNLSKKIKILERENPTVVSEKLFFKKIDPLPHPPHKMKYLNEAGEFAEKEVQLHDIIGRLNTVIKFINNLYSKDD